MIYLAIPGVVVAALGALIAAVAVFVATMQDAGGHCDHPRKGTHLAIARAELARVAGLLAALAVRLWERLATAELPAPAAPVPAPRRHVNGRKLPDQPRRTPRPGPFTEVDMPACAEPEPGPARGGPDLGPLAPIARPWTESQVVYNQASQLTVADAERLSQELAS